MKVLSSLADLLYPRKCLVCGTMLSLDEKYLCEKCIEDIPLTYFWSWKENPSEMILWGRCYFERVVSLFYYKRDNNYKNLLHNLKYNSDKGVGLFLGRMLGKYLRNSPCANGSFSDQIDYLVPVPLHWYKKWKRGYNQAEVVARGIAEGMWNDKKGEKIVTTVLKRQRFTPTQTKITMGSKWHNVENAFSLKNGSQLEGKRILLIDDVLTSGATAEACWDSLKTIPEIKVSFATLAYVEQNN